MKKIISLILSFICICTLQFYSQTVKKIRLYDKTSFGLGLGMDYGGIGGNILVCPLKNIGVFIGGGYAFAGFGYNAGIKLRTVPKSERTYLSVYGLWMYGYNAAIVVRDASRFNKFFYGNTIGVGIDYRPVNDKSGYLSLGLLIPFRSADVLTYINNLRKYQNVIFKNGLTPVGISIAYRIIII
jgi:hypothetical protein